MALLWAPPMLAVGPEAEVVDESVRRALPPPPPPPLSPPLPRLKLRLPPLPPAAVLDAVVDVALLRVGGSAAPAIARSAASATAGVGNAPWGTGPLAFFEAAAKAWSASKPEPGTSPSSAATAFAPPVRLRRAVGAGGGGARDARLTVSSTLPSEAEGFVDDLLRPPRDGLFRPLLLPLPPLFDLIPPGAPPPAPPIPRCSPAAELMVDARPSVCPPARGTLMYTHLELSKMTLCGRRKQWCGEGRSEADNDRVIRTKPPRAKRWHRNTALTAPLETAHIV